jgi:hypothetical protein
MCVDDRDGQPIHSQLSDSDAELASHTLELSDAEQVPRKENRGRRHSASRSDFLFCPSSMQTFVFNNVESKPVLSVLRHFSAPVKLVHQYLPPPALHGLIV